jgi:hypothetical protein
MTVYPPKRKVVCPRCRFLVRIVAYHHVRTSTAKSSDHSTKTAFLSWNENDFIEMMNKKKKNWILHLSLTRANSNKYKYIFIDFFINLRSAKKFQRILITILLNFTSFVKFSVQMSTCIRNRSLSVILCSFIIINSNCKSITMFSDVIARRIFVRTTCRRRDCSFKADRCTDRCVLFGILRATKDP